MDIGQSKAYESPVPDGCIVLVRQGSNRGAFILSNQRTGSETADVQWFSRSDGGGRLVPTDPSVATGTAKVVTRKANGTKEIIFTHFAIEWGIATDGEGWVYFSVLPNDYKSPPKYEMCITGETDITRIDANDPKWSYRGRSSMRPFLVPGSEHELTYER
jgi:hypothetical protein